MLSFFFLFLLLLLSSAPIPVARSVSRSAIFISLQLRHLAPHGSLSLIGGKWGTGMGIARSSRVLHPALTRSIDSRFNGNERPNDGECPLNQPDMTMTPKCFGRYQRTSHLDRPAALSLDLRLSLHSGRLTAVKELRLSQLPG